MIVYNLLYNIYINNVLGNTTNLTLYTSGNINSLEIEAELYRKWVVLDVYILKRSFDIENIFQNIQRSIEQSNKDSIYDEYSNHIDDFQLPNTSKTTTTTNTTIDSSSNSNNNLDSNQIQCLNDDKKKKYHEFILGIPVDLNVCNYLQNKGIYKVV